MWNKVGVFHTIMTLVFWRGIPATSGASVEQGGVFHTFIPRAEEDARYLLRDERESR